MTDDLVKRMRAVERDYDLYDHDIIYEAADRIEELEARLKQTEDRLKQYDLGILQIRRWIETGEIPR